MKTRKRVYCTDCKRVRLHDLRVRKDESGHCIRVWICRKCCRTSPAGGFCCKGCGHDRFRVPSSNGRYSRPGCVVREKVCRKCSKRHKTVERIEGVIG